MVLSNVSISVSSGFSTDLISTASFRYVKAPKPSARAQEEAAAEAAKKSKVANRDSEEVNANKLSTQNNSTNFSLQHFGLL